MNKFIVNKKIKKKCYLSVIVSVVTECYKISNR